MNLKRSVSNLMTFAGFVLLLAATGCSDTPPSIDFTTPSGQVEPSNTQVTIEGKVVKGTNPINKLSVITDDSNQAQIAEIEIASDGSFSYDGFSTGTGDFSVCRFRVMDEKFLKNDERIVYIKGSPTANRGIPAQYNTLDQAVNVLLNENLIDTAVAAVQNVVNENFAELVNDAMGGGPLITMNATNNIEITVDTVSVGHLSLGEIDIQNGNWLTANDIIVDDIVLDGTASWKILGVEAWEIDIPFGADIDLVDIDELDVTVFVKESSNNIVLRIDADDLDDTFWGSLNPTLRIGSGVLLPNGFTNFLLRIMGGIFRAIFNTLAIPIMDVDDLAMTLDTTGMVAYGVPLDMSLDIAAWFPVQGGVEENPIFQTNPGCTDCGEMYMQLGLAITPTYPEDSPNPLDYYFSTPGDALPGYQDLQFTQPAGYTFEHNNLNVGINDDMINMGAWAAQQAGLLDGLDVTSTFGYLAGEALSGSILRKANVKVYMNTPPIADFSGAITEHPAETDPATGDTTCYAGKFRVRNMVIKIDDLLAGAILDTARVCIDTDVDIHLKLVDGGTKIEGFMNKSESTIAIKYLYVNNANLTKLTDLSNDIVEYIMDVTLKALIKIKVPAITMYDANLQPYLYQTDVGANNMIVRLGVSEYVPE